jgi:hypothetical protein
MSTAPTFKGLRALSRQELEREHDSLVEHVAANPKDYQAEIERREAAAQGERMEAMTQEMAELNRKITRLTVGMYWMTGLALGITALTLILSLTGVLA